MYRFGAFLFGTLALIVALVNRQWESHYFLSVAVFCLAVLFGIAAELEMLRREIRRVFNRKNNNS